MLSTQPMQSQWGWVDPSVPFSSSGLGPCPFTAGFLHYYQTDLGHTRLCPLPLVLGPDGRSVLKCVSDVNPLLKRHSWLPSTFKA